MRRWLRIIWEAYIEARKEAARARISGWHV